MAFIAFTKGEGWSVLPGRSKGNDEAHGGGGDDDYVQGNKGSDYVNGNNGKDHRIRLCDYINASPELQFALERIPMEV